MDVYKVRIEDTESKIIDKEGFEAETFRRDPWYQPGSAGKLAQFAVCPACDNPVQLVGLYELPPNVKNPFGKHATKSIRGIAPFDSEARNDCPYFQPRQHKKTERKTRFDGVPRKILKLLIEQFDRVVYILEKETQLVLSENALRGMLQRYKESVATSIPARRFAMCHGSLLTCRTPPACLARRSLEMLSW